MFKLFKPYLVCLSIQTLQVSGFSLLGQMLPASQHYAQGVIWQRPFAHNNSPVLETHNVIRQFGR